MPVPNADSAVVPAEKLTDYLLNEEHPVGKHKAKWFRSIGYDLAVPSVLEADILNLVQTSEDYSEKSSPFGTKYIVLGKISSPSGVDANLVTVWIIEASEDNPRLVTAYPGEKS